MKTLDERIADLEAMLDSGMMSFTVDGETQTVDLNQIRRRLEELKSQKAGAKRRTMITLDLGNAFG